MRNNIRKSQDKVFLHPTHTPSGDVLQFDNEAYDALRSQTAN